MGGQRKALIIANDEYESDALRRLKAPAADARALAHVLGDRDIGGFNVDVVLNEPAHSVEARIEDLFADSQSDDLLLLHFSCHGLKSEAGELFFAARNTRPDRLGSTAIAADFIQRCIKTCRARSVVLFLDCCYGGAFGQGVTVRASGSANVLESFPAGKLGGGKGRAVITASSSMEYAFEGNELADDHQQQPSLFTSALVEGLETGEADRDEDGLVSLNELYEFVFDKVREQNPNQTPSRDVEMQGELYVARSQRKRIRPVPIPAEVQAALQDPNMFTRLGAVSELRARLNSEDIAAALGAHAALVDLSRTDIQYVGDAAGEALAGAAIRVVENELSFGQVGQRATTGPLTLHLSGPRVARTCTLSTSESWIRIEESAQGHLVSVDTSVQGRFRGSITVKGLTGEAVVPVLVEVVSADVAVTSQPVVVKPEPNAVKPEPNAVKPEPVVVKPEAVVVKPEPNAVDWAPERVDQTPVTPAPNRGDDPAYSSKARRFQLFSWVALAGGALMVVGVFLPFQWGESMTEQAPELIAYLLLVGSLALAGGICALLSRTRLWVAPGLVLASGATSLWGLAYLIGLPLREGGYDNIGFQLDMVATLLVIAAGALAAVGLARLPGVHVQGLSRQDRLGWVIAALGTVGALMMLSQAADISNDVDTWYAAQAVVAACLAFALPAGAVLVVPRRVGVSIMAGWLVGGFALTIHYWLWVGKYTDGDTPKIDTFSLTLLALAATTAIWSRQQHKQS